MPHAGLSGRVLPVVLGRHATAVPGVYTPRGALFLRLQRQQRRHRLRRVKGCCPPPCLIKCDARSCDWRFAEVGDWGRWKCRPARPLPSRATEPRADRREQRGKARAPPRPHRPREPPERGCAGRQGRGLGGPRTGRGGAWWLRRAELVSDPAAPPRVAPHLLPLPYPELRGYAAGAALGPGTPGCGQPSALPAAPKYR